MEDLSFLIRKDSFIKFLNLKYFLKNYKSNSFINKRVKEILSGFYKNESIINLNQKDLIWVFKEIREDLILFTKIIDYGIIFFVKFLKTNELLKNSNLKFFLKYFFEFKKREDDLFEYNKFFKGVTGF